MSKKIYLFSLVLLALAFVSCSETEEVGKYDNWRARNEAFIDSLANVYATAADKGGLDRTEMLTAPGNYIYYKVMPSMTDHVVKAGSPKYTDYVKVYYKGTNILGEYFDGLGIQCYRHGKQHNGSDALVRAPCIGWFLLRCRIHGYRPCDIRTYGKR